MKQVFTLAWRNFVAYKKLYARIIVALIALLFLITLFVGFTVSINAKQNHYAYQTISSNYTYGDRPLKEGEISERFQTLKVKRFLPERFNSEIFGADEREWIPMQSFVIDCQNKRYFYDNGEGDFEVYFATSDIITQNDRREAGDGVELLLGRYPEKTDEIVLSEDMLTVFGLSRDVLGKSVTFRAVRYIDSDGKPLPPFSMPVEPSKWRYEVLPFETQVTVCGILTSDYAKLSGRFYAFRPTALAHENSVWASFGAETKYMCSIDGWLGNSEADYLSKDKELWYCGEDSVQMMDVTAKMRLVTERLTLYFGSVLIFGIVFTLVLLCDKLGDFQMKNSGELLIAGLTNIRLFGVWLIQLAIASAIAVVVAVALTVGATYGINAVIYNALSVTLDVSASGFALTTLVGLVAVISVTASVFCFIAIKFKRRQTRELLDV